MSYILFFNLCLIYSLLFIAVHLAHFRIFRPQSIFIPAAFDSILTILIMLLGFYLIFPSSQSYFELFSAAVAMFLLNVIYIILGPLMAERSLTVYLLLNVDSRINSQGSKVSVTDVENSTNLEYVGKNQMINKRIMEQVEAGSFICENDKLSLSKKGCVIAFIYKSLRYLLKINPKF